MPDKDWKKEANAILELLHGWSSDCDMITHGLKRAYRDGQREALEGAAAFVDYGDIGPRVILDTETRIALGQALRAKAKALVAGKEK